MLSCASVGIKKDRRQQGNKKEGIFIIPVTLTQQLSYSFLAAQPRKLTINPRLSNQWELGSKKVKPHLFGHAAGFVRLIQDLIIED